MSLYKSNLKYHILLFLITPILGLVYGLKTKSKKIIRWSIFVFTVIYGSLFSFSIFNSEKGATEGGSDGSRHWNNVYNHYQNLDFEVWWEELIAILSFAPYSTTNDDVFIHVLSYLTGTVFAAPGLFFLGVAIVYGYFFSGALVKILSYVNWNSKFNKFYFIYFLILLVLWMGPSAMHTVRTWTGMWVLIYALLSYHETKKRKYLLLALTPPLIHIAFLALAIPIWLVLFSGYRNPKVYFIIFIISIFVSSIVEQTNLLKFAQQTELTAQKTKAYYVDDERQVLRDDALEEKAQDANFYKEYQQYRIHYFVLSGLAIFIFVFLRKRGSGAIENTLFSYALATAAFANFFTSIYALHSRDWQIAGILILSLLVIFLSKQNLKNISLSFLKVRMPLFVFVTALFPYMLFKISALLSFTSVYILLLPIFSWIEPDVSISLRGLIGLFI
jgi:hypothetical protein